MSSRRLLGGGPPGSERVVESTASVKNWMVERFDEIPAKRCPCGWTRRAFATPDNQTATIHYVDIQDDARTHYHRRLTEIYLILETDGECFMELDGERVPVRPLTTIFIKPGCRHRAVGRMKIVNIPVPAFDPEDEHFD